jgi:CRISPR/Cas system-associated exonuclease Cas4 (RecB family)
MTEQKIDLFEKAEVPDEYLNNYDGFADHWMSVSMLKSFMMCPYAGYLKYIDRRPEPKHVRPTMGSGAHKGREVNLRQKIETQEDLPVSDVTDAARDYVVETFENNEIAGSAEFEGKNTEQLKNITIDLSVEIAAKDREIFQPEIQPVAVEEAFAVKYPGLDWILVGKVDNREKGRMRDLKTGKRAFGQSKADDEMGLSTYGMLYLSSSSELITEYLIDNIVATGKTPAKTNAYRTTRTKEDMERQLKRFMAWGQSIQAGVFPPCDSAHWRCGPEFCGYYKQCEYGGG